MKQGVLSQEMGYSIAVGTQKHAIFVFDAIFFASRCSVDLEKQFHESDPHKFSQEIREYSDVKVEQLLGSMEEMNSVLEGLQKNPLGQSDTKRITKALSAFDRNMAGLLSTIEKQIPQTVHEWVSGGLMRFFQDSGVDLKGREQEVSSAALIFLNELDDKTFDAVKDGFIKNNNAGRGLSASAAEYAKDVKSKVSQAMDKIAPYAAPFRASVNDLNIENPALRQS